MAPRWVLLIALLSSGCAMFKSGTIEAVEASKKKPKRLTVRFTLALDDEHFCDSLHRGGIYVLWKDKLLARHVWTVRGKCQGTWDVKETVALADPESTQALRNHDAPPLGEGGAYLSDDEYANTRITDFRKWAPKGDDYVVLVTQFERSFSDNTMKQHDDEFVVDSSTLSEPFRALDEAQAAELAKKQERKRQRAEASRREERERVEAVRLEEEEAERKREQKREADRRAGIDWSEGKPSKPPACEATVLLGPTEGEFTAGSRLRLQVQVRNRGHGSVFQLAGAVSSQPDELGFPRLRFGKVEPGKTVTRTVAVDVPKTRKAGPLDVTVRFTELNGYEPEPVQARFTIRPAERPAIHLSALAADDGTGTSTGNGDGVVQRGEAIEIRVTVSNLGGAPASSAQLTLRAEEEGQFEVFGDETRSLGTIAAGTTKHVSWSIAVKRGFERKRIPLVVVFEERSPFQVTKELDTSLDIDKRAPRRVVVINRVLLVTKRTPLFAGARDGAKQLGEVGAGARLRAVGELGSFLRVAYGQQHAWIKRADTSFEVQAAPDPKQPAGEVTIVKEFANTPPMVVLSPTSERTALSKTRVWGKAMDDKGIASLRIYANGREVPASTRGPAGVVRRAKGKQQTSKRCSFDLQVALEPGPNTIEVVATDTDGLETRDAISVTRQTKKGTIYAALIGISAYKKVRQLRYARADALAMRDYLVGELEVPEANVHVLLDEQATLPAIKRLLGSTMRKLAGPQDTVILFYAGHGGQEADESAAGGVRSYLYPVETDEGDKFATAFDMKELQTVFNRIRARNRVFLADCCYAGAARDPKGALRGGNPVLDAMSKGKGKVILSACQDGEVAQESEKYGHGLFTHFLLEGLRNAKADLNQDGLVDTDEIANYVEERVLRASGKAQRPKKAGSGKVVLGGKVR